MTAPNLNGLRVTERRGNAIFVRLPRELWRLCGPDGSCICAVCKASGRAAYWDTLAIAAAPTGAPSDCTWTVHHPDTRAYELVRVVELDAEGNASSYRTTAVDGPGYWSVSIPYVHGVPTEWHPTESTGPFATLSRGAFRSEGLAIVWAEDKLAGHPYTLVFHRTDDELARVAVR